MTQVVVVVVVKTRKRVGFIVIADIRKSPYLIYPLYMYRTRSGDTYKPLRPYPAHFAR